MPTVLRIHGFRVVIYPNDHRPAHVHLVGAGKEAVFHLHCPDGPPELRQAYGLSLREANILAECLRAELNRLCPEWRAIHGDY